MDSYKTISGLLCTLLLVVTAACSGGTTNTKFGNAGDTKNHAINNLRGTNAANVSRGSTINIHNNRNLVINQTLARQIESLPEVKSARVVSTESNVYVAVRLNDQMPSVRNHSSGMAGAHSMHNNTTPLPAATPRPYSGITGNSFDHAQSLGNAPISSSEIAAQTKQTIVDQVRTLSPPSLHHVYVAANPDFFQVLENYGRAVKQGKSLSGVLDEFNTVVQRIFPTTDGTGAYGGSTSSGNPSVQHITSGDDHFGGAHR